jgi:hypothetical protein
MQITLVRLAFTGLVVDFLVAVFLVVDFFTVFLVVDFLVLETANTVEKLFPHLNEE